MRIKRDWMLPPGGIIATHKSVYGCYSETGNRPIAKSSAGESRVL
jgi:hypothetical protein